MPFPSARPAVRHRRGHLLDVEQVLADVITGHDGAPLCTRRPGQHAGGPPPERPLPT
ncbi:hypothetical protein [Kitasatospora sp. NPDC059327]|uniref:hypothetical protein n=1 Tax=Kitasatospora sp. NPDC059327 TaxID=3346803 RepID=UPI0036C67BCE